MRVLFAVLVALVGVGGAAVAQSPAPVLSGQAVGGIGQAPSGASPPAKAVKRQRKGRARRVAIADKGREGQRGPSTVEEAVTSCLSLWEPATHMTKGQWAGACRRVAERVRWTG